jgi:hypothetical protein
MKILNFYNHMMKIGIIIITMICLSVLLDSCAVMKNSHSGYLDKNDMKKMSVGMTIDEVTEYCGAVLFDIPILQYPSRSGGYYKFYFWPTNEVDIPASFQDDALRLIAITKTNSGEETEYYVLPGSVKGKVFTGIKDW